MTTKIKECSICGKKTEHNTKIKLKNFPFCKSLACKECGNTYYY